MVEEMLITEYILFFVNYIDHTRIYFSLKYKILDFILLFQHKIDELHL